MYKSSVSAKDETIMSLTNKIFDLECNTGQGSSQQNLTAINLAEMDKLKVGQGFYSKMYQHVLPVLIDYPLSY